MTVRPDVHSAGVAADTTLRQADIAMYRAKNGGGNRSVVFDSDMDRRFRRNLDTASALHRALDNDELVAYFQPIVNPANRRLVGLEALVRWDAPGTDWCHPMTSSTWPRRTGSLPESVSTC